MKKYVVGYFCWSNDFFAGTVDFAIQMRLDHNYLLFKVHTETPSHDRVIDNNNSKSMLIYYDNIS